MRCCKVTGSDTVVPGVKFRDWDDNTQIDNDSNVDNWAISVDNVEVTKVEMLINDTPVAIDFQLTALGCPGTLSGLCWKSTAPWKPGPGLLGENKLTIKACDGAAPANCAETSISVKFNQ